MLISQRFWAVICISRKKCAILYVKSKVYKINEQTHLLYYFVALEGIFSKFEINEEWVDYLIRNRTILLEWVRYNLIGYLQDRNPNVPGIVEKVQKPEKRDLRRVSDYWKTIIEIDPKMKYIKR